MAGTSLPSAGASGESASVPSDGWADALDPALREVAAAKGWQTPADAVRSYASLERLLGAEKIALPPANAPAADWDAVWDRLGRPRHPEGYAFKKPDGYDAYSDELAQWARKTCHKVGMPARMAEAFHDEFVGFARNLVETTESRQAMNDVELHAFMEREWGSQRDEKLGAFRKAANAFMDSPQSLDRLQQIMGTPGLLRMFVKIGEWLGEDRAVGTGAALVPAHARGGRAGVLHDPPGGDRRSEAPADGQAASRPPETGRARRDAHAHDLSGMRGGSD